MKQNDYQKIRETLSSQCTAAIRSFAVTPDNKDVYAFCIYCDAGNGWYSIALNTQDAFEKRVAEVYSNYADIDLHGFCGVKYNPPDFRFFGLQSESSRLDQLCDRYRSFLEGRYDRLSEDAFNRLAREHETLFVDQAVAAILGAEHEFSQLRRTDWSAPEKVNQKEC